MWHVISRCYHVKTKRTEHIIHIVSNERSDELVFLSRQFVRLFCQHRVYLIHILTIHNGSVLLMLQLIHLCNKTIVFFKKSRKFIIKRRSAHFLLCIVYIYLYVTFLQDKRHDAIIIHEQCCHTHRIYCACKMKLAMQDVTRVYTLYLILV